MISIYCYQWKTLDLTFLIVSPWPLSSHLTPIRSFFLFAHAKTAPQCILCTFIGNTIVGWITPTASFEMIRSPPSDVSPSFHIILDWTGRGWQHHASLIQAPKWSQWLVVCYVVCCSGAAKTPLALANRKSTWLHMLKECVCCDGSWVWGCTAMIGCHFHCWWRLIAMVERLAWFPFFRGPVSMQKVQNKLYEYMGINTIIYLRLQYLHNTWKILPGKKLMHCLAANPVCQTIRYIKSEKYMYARDCVKIQHVIELVQSIGTSWSLVLYATII